MRPKWLWSDLGFETHPPARTRVPLLIDLSQGGSDVQPEHVARPGAPGREEGEVQAWEKRWSPKWRGGVWADRTADALSSQKAGIYSFDKYFQLCRSYTQTAVLIVQWMVGPHQGLGDVGQGYISV